MRAAAAQEDKTEKSVVTPGPLAPAREQLGDLLLELKQTSEALKEFESTLVKEPNAFDRCMGQPRRPGWAAIVRLSNSTSRSCSRSLSAPINLDGKNLRKLITKSIRSNKSQVGHLGLLSENREGDDSVSVRPRSIAHSICTSSPTHSTNSADTSLSDFWVLGG
jgi:hypothetical protein